MSAVSESLTIGPRMAGTLMTPEEFDVAGDWEEGYVYELINDVLVVAPPPGIEERGKDVYTTPLLPGFELPLARLFAEAELFSDRTSSDE